MTGKENRRREFDTHLRLDPDIAQRLKVAVAEERLNQTILVNRALLEWLDRRERAKQAHD